MRDKALKGLLAGDAASCDAAVAWMKTYNFPSPDEARWSGEDAILIYDWCHGRISAADRTAIVDKWNKRLGELNADSWGGPHMPTNNYFWGYVRNGLLWGITSFHDNPQAQDFIDHALTLRYQDKFNAWYDKFGAGGVTLEGTQYGPYMLGYPVIAFTTAADYGFDAWIAPPFWRDAVYYLNYATTPTKTRHHDGTGTFFELFPFSDDQFFKEYASAESGDYADFLAGQVIHAPETMHAAVARAWLARTKVPPSWYVAAELASTSASPPPAALPVDYYAAGSSYFYGGQGAAVDSTVFMLQLGAFDASSNDPVEMPNDGGVGHNHLDVGNFNLWRKGRWISRETTGYSDQIQRFEGGGTVDTHEAVAHNTVLFEGRGQIDGFRGLAKVLRLQSTQGFAFAAVDMTDAYRAEVDEDWQSEGDWPFAEKAIREFVYVRALDALVILDRLQSGSDSLGPLYKQYYHGPKLDAAQVRKGFVLHATGTGSNEAGNPWSITSAGRATATIGTQRMDLATLLPAAPTYRVLAEGSSIGQYRLEYTVTGAADTYFLNVLSMRDDTDAEVTASLAIEDGGNTYNVTLSHPTRGTANVRFAKGMASQGGTVSIAGGMPLPLRGNVQEMRIDDNGPKWKGTMPPMQVCDLREPLNGPAGALRIGR
jgi:hypothetical protein